MKVLNGWWLPDDDNYFGAFTENGFQLDHLREAFKHVRQWRCAVDCGAHCGFWTKEMAERFDSVFAFEAAPDTYRCLEKNIVGYSNVRMFNHAVGAMASSCRIVEDDKRKGNSGSRYIKFGPYIPIVALDEMNIETCDLLKIDVEGYEFAVIEGARKLIEKHRPVIIMETDKKFAKVRYGVDDDAAEKSLIDLGYREVAHMRPDKVFVIR